MDRILVLEGLADLQHLGKPLVGENAIENRECCDLKAERPSHTLLGEAVAHCESVYCRTTPAWPTIAPAAKAARAKVIRLLRCEPVAA